MIRIFLLLASLIWSCASPPQLQRFEQSTRGLGTEFRIVLYATDTELACAAFQEAWNRMEALDAKLSDYKPDSELARLSAKPMGQGLRVSDDLWTVLVRSQEISAQSEGAFDITVGPYVRLWRRSFRQGRLPSAARLAQAREQVGHSHLKLASDEQVIILGLDSMQLDLGGIAKGFIIDEMLAEIRGHGIRSALVEGGGDIAVGDAPPNSKGWTIAVRAQKEVGAVLLLENCAVATSGDFARFVDIEGQRYSHLIDPATGLGLTSAIAACVIAPDAMTADSLASAACVMGREVSLVWLESFPSVEARIWMDQKEPLGACETSGFRKTIVNLPVSSSTAEL
ncbi:MAG: thiamine biosynthesis lipoprotein [Planctomycetota bacterium]|jgi:thiamine biosynthesis lipoprotein